jgi:hypothetical protein
VLPERSIAGLARWGKQDPAVQAQLQMLNELEFDDL